MSRSVYYRNLLALRDRTGEFLLVTDALQLFQCFLQTRAKLFARAEGAGRWRIP